MGVCLDGSGGTWKVIVTEPGQASEVLCETLSLTAAHNAVDHYLHGHRLRDREGNCPLCDSALQAARDARRRRKR